MENAENRYAVNVLAKGFVQLILDYQKELSDDERKEFWSTLKEEYCVHCGGEGRGCQCWNDE